MHKSIKIIKIIKIITNLYKFQTMELSEIDLIEDFPLLPKKALFFAGIIKVYSGLSLSMILKFLSRVYEQNLDGEVLNEIESVLYDGKIGSAKEILDKISKNCGICKKSVDSATILLCHHNFHENCIKNELSIGLELKCPICMIKIDNSTIINKEDQINDPQLPKQLFDKNCIKCPFCNQIFESDAKGLINCVACQENFCRSCGYTEKSCKCSKSCSAYNKKFK